MADCATLLTAGARHADLLVGGPDLLAGLRAEVAGRGLGVSVPALAAWVRHPVLGGIRQASAMPLCRRGASLGEGKRDPGGPLVVHFGKGDNKDATVHPLCRRRRPRVGAGSGGAGRVAQEKGSGVEIVESQGARGRDAARRGPHSPATPAAPLWRPRQRAAAPKGSLSTGPVPHPGEAPLGELFPAAQQHPPVGPHCVVAVAAAAQLLLGDPLPHPDDHLVGSPGQQPVHRGGIWRRRVERDIADRVPERVGLVRQPGLHTGPRPGPVGPAPGGQVDEFGLPRVGAPAHPPGSFPPNLKTQQGSGGHGPFHRRRAAASCPVKVEEPVWTARNR